MRCGRPAVASVAAGLITATLALARHCGGIMRTSLVHRLATLTVALASIACGGGGDSTGPNNGGNGQFRFTARIDGTSWASTAGVELVGVTLAVPGIYVLTGTQLGTGGLTLVISLYNIP